MADHHPDRQPLEVAVARPVGQQHRVEQADRAPGAAEQGVAAADAEGVKLGIAGQEVGLQRKAQPVGRGDVGETAHHALRALRAPHVR